MPSIIGLGALMSVTIWAQPAPGPLIGSTQTPPRELLGISVVVPAWNEEVRLPRMLDQYLPMLRASTLPFEVVVVTDGSTDRTAEVAQKYAGLGVRVLEFPHKLGKGGAVLQGFRSAGYDVLGFLDADAPITPASFALLLSRLRDSDVAIASRYHSESESIEVARLSRRIMSRCWNLLARMVLNLDLHDTQCGAKVFKRYAIDSVIDKVWLTNWAFDVSLLYHLRRAGFRVVEVPVNWSSDRGTKLKVEKVVPAMLLSLIGIRLMAVGALKPYTTPVAKRLYQLLGAG